MKDYYRVLGVEKDASAETIKAAFRKLIKQYHPDLNGGDKAAEKKCCEINEAYETLSDPEKRRVYDEQRAAPRRSATRRAATDDAANGGFSGGFRVEDILSDLFGGAGGFTAAQKERSLDARAECGIMPWTAALGGRIEVRVGEKTLSVKIPPNTQTGQTLRLRGQGFANGNGKTGDLLLTIRLENPKVITPEMRTLYEKLAALR